MIEYKTIRQFASESGYSEEAIRTKISRGVFRENEVWVRSPDSRVLISIQGFNLWVRNEQVYELPVPQVSESPLHTKSNYVESLYHPAPLNLT